MCHLHVVCCLILYDSPFLLSTVSLIFLLHLPCGVKRTSPDTAIHEQNGYAKVHDDKYTFMTNVDNDNCDTTYTHKHNMREV